MTCSIQTRTRRVLLAEDDAAMRRLLSLALRADGFDVIEASNGGELLERVGDLAITHRHDGASVHLVITDVRMPIASGLEALRKLREFDRTMPVIVITAFGDPHVHEIARQLGAHVFDKPFDLEDLRTAAASLT